MSNALQKLYSRSPQKSKLRAKHLLITKIQTKNHDSSFTFSHSSSQNNIEKIKKELSFLRKELYSSTFELSKLKADTKKNEDDFKKNSAFLEEIIKNSPSITGVIIKQILNNEQPTPLKEELPIPDKYIDILVERYALNLLKAKNREFSNKLLLKEKEIKLLKEATKVRNINTLMGSLLENTNELRELNKQYDELKEIYDELNNEYLKVKHDRLYYKSQYNEATNLNNKLTKDNTELAERNIEYEKEVMKHKQKYFGISSNSSNSNKRRITSLSSIKIQISNSCPISFNSITI